jgi:hypothetical protein
MGEEDREGTIPEPVPSIFIVTFVYMHSEVSDIPCDETNDRPKMWLFSPQLVDRLLHQPVQNATNIDGLLPVEHYGRSFRAVTEPRG